MYYYILKKCLSVCFIFCALKRLDLNVDFVDPGVSEMTVNEASEIADKLLTRARVTRFE